MIEDEMKQSKINALLRRIESLAIQYEDLSNEKPIDISTELKKIQREVNQSRFQKANRLSSKLQNSLEQRRERDKNIIQKITTHIVADLSYFESTS